MKFRLVTSLLLILVLTGLYLWWVQTGGDGSLAGSQAGSAAPAVTTTPPPPTDDRASALGRVRIF